MRRFVLFFVNVINWFSKLGFTASKVILCTMVVTISYNVFVRYVLNRPTIWTEEVNAYFLVFLTFSGIAEIERRRAHIKFDLLSNLLTGKRAVILDLFTLCCALFWCALVTWKSLGITLVAHSYQVREASPLLIPRFIPYSFLFFGLALLGLQFLVRLGKDISSLLSKGEVKWK